MKSDFQKDYCYACDNLATTREHVPPKCLFPNELGVNLRKNLITVPSCEEHNCNKSNEDEFLLASLAGIVGCNEIGLLHKFTKVDRAIRRSGGRLLKKALKIQEIEIHELPNGKKIDIAWGTPDLERLDACFSLIGQGLYFSERGKRFRGKVKSEIVYIPINDRGRKGYREFVVDEMNKELSGISNKGDNPEVFQWALGPEDASGACCARMIFYGNLAVFLGFIPENFNEESFVNIYDIAQSVTKPVYLNKDGKSYRIN